MIDGIKKVILENKYLLKLKNLIYDPIRDRKKYRAIQHTIFKCDPARPTIYYLGIPMHANLGDLAQGVCIRKWIEKHFADWNVVEIETNSLVNTTYSALPLLKKSYRNQDFIIFQSGYTTTDLGGYADEMHRAVMETLPEARCLMMPQTIFFEREENKQRTAQAYNAMNHMLYLARDEVSYHMALDMFPDIPVRLYPDIVTTLIGSMHFDNERSGIMMCFRDDTEKFYSDQELSVLADRCRKIAHVEMTDTTKKADCAEIVAHAKEYIEKEVEKYSHYKVMITDRYHGTILSLVAGTPVIIIKTTDHKVTTGANWFRGVYDDYVFLADNLEEAYQLADQLCHKDLSYDLKPYFEREYYDKLPALLDLVK